MRVLFILPLFFILSIHCAEEVLFATNNRDQTDLQTIKSELEMKIKAEVSNENTEIKKAVDDLKKIVQELMTKINDYDENAYCTQTYCNEIDGRVTEEQGVRKTKNDEIEASIGKETKDRQALEARVNGLDCTILPEPVIQGFEPGCKGAVGDDGTQSEDYCRNQIWYQNCCKWEKQQCVPINDGGLELLNAGKNCWDECDQKQGPCEYCGSKGLCCRRVSDGWVEISNGCNGFIGGLTGHECSMYDDDQNIYEVVAQVGTGEDDSCDCDMWVDIYDNSGNMCQNWDFDQYSQDFETGMSATWAGERLYDCNNWVAKGGISKLEIYHGGSDGLRITDWYITGSTKTYHCVDGNFYDDDDHHTIKCY